MSRRIARSLLGFLSAGLALTSCRDATLPAATAAPTRPQLATSAPASPTRPPTATVAARPTITSTPVVDPTPGWGATPQEPVESYTLTTWSAAETLQWAGADLGPFPRSSSDRQYDEQTLGHVVAATLYDEVILRYPDSPEANRALHARLNPDLLLPFQRDSVEMFRRAFERRLNATPSLTPSSATWATIAAEVLGPEVPIGLQTVAADDLLGDGTPSWVLNLRANDNNVALLALAGTPGAYRVVALRSNWFPDFLDDYHVSVRDLNANGRPEVLIEDNYRGTGFTSACDKVLTDLEWREGGFSNLTPDVATSAQTDYGDCLPIEILPADDGPATIVTGYTFYASCRIEDDWVSREPRLVRRFAWDGSQFALVDESFLPPGELLGGDIPIDACTLTWVNEIGPESALVREALARALSTDDTRLVAAYSEQFGPAYHDFFVFKLGVSQAMIGADQAARATLKSVRDAPRSPEYSAASTLASVFLTAYEAHGAVAGCRAVDGLLDPTEYVIGWDAIFAPFDTDAMRTAWGFADGAWALRGRPLYDSPWLQTDALNLCSPAVALRATLNGADLFTTTALIQYLDARAIAYAGVQEVDVDGDGRRDWVLLLGTGRAGTLDVWALLNRATGIDAQWVSGTSARPGVIPSAVAVLAPNPEGPTLTVYQWTSGTVVLQFVRLATGVRVIDRLGEIPSIHLSDQQGFEIEPGAGLDTGSTLTVRQSPTRDWTPAWFTVGWDSRAQSLVEVERAGDPYRRQLHEAERLLFEARNPAAASALLETLEAHWAVLPATVDDSAYSLPTFRPYLRYLQGLTAEALGDSAAAVQAYWALWHDYPLHPLSAIVQQKLTRVITTRGP